MILLFAARSKRDDAFTISFSFLDFLAILSAISSLLRRIEFIEAFLFETLSALLAVLVTGIKVFYQFPSIAYTE